MDDTEVSSHDVAMEGTDSQTRSRSPVRPFRSRYIDELFANLFRQPVLLPEHFLDQRPTPPDRWAATRLANFHLRWALENLDPEWFLASVADKRSILEEVREAFSDPITPTVIVSPATR